MKDGVAVEATGGLAVDRARAIWARLGRFQERGVLLALVVVVIVASLSSSVFLRPDNLVGILTDITFEGFIACGMGLCLIAGDIDVSVGSTYGLVGVVTALAMISGLSIPAAIVGGLLLGVLLGLVNGVIATFLKIPAIIVTLATLGIYGGLALAITNGTYVGGLPSSPFFAEFGQGELFGFLPYISVVFLLAAVITGIVLARTPFGFRVYAVGSNPAAARLVGIDVARLRVTVLTLSGFMAGLAGVCSVAYLKSAAPTGGTGYELDVLAALIIGGAKLSGGRGTILGSILGLLVVGVIRNLVILTGVSPDWQTVVSGAVLIVAVSIDRLANRAAIR